MKIILFNLGLALEGVMSNKVRALLTALGIVFGVGAVIAMMAIGKGAEKAIIAQMKLIGTNNIVISSVLPEEQEGNSEDDSGSGNQVDKRELFSPGLNLNDLKAVAVNIPTVEFTSPEIILQKTMIYKGNSKKANAVGVTNDFFSLHGQKISKGNKFHPIHFEKGSAVCILGYELAKNLFSGEEAIGKYVKCGPVWLKVIGTLQKRQANAENLEELGIRDPNQDLYMPIETAFVRYEDRALINRRDIGRSRRSGEVENYHQIDKAIVHITDASYLRNSATLISRMLKRRHNDNVDFQIEIPELLIQQQQKTQETFNMVLAIIAGISLLVGGIGIMNIMLASVWERVKEIGIRRSLGATRKDIILQFLLEAVLISVFGGLVGILLGIVSAEIIARTADIPTQIDLWALTLSFGVAVAIGLIFGLLPAEKAAAQDPIKSLRTE
jgi:putative ABC transport system permease protein